MRTKFREAGQWAEVSWLHVFQLLAFLSFGGWFNIPAGYYIFEGVNMLFCTSVLFPWVHTASVSEADAVDPDELEELKSLSLLQALTNQHHLEMTSVWPVRASWPVFHSRTGLFMVSIAVLPSYENKTNVSTVVSCTNKPVLTVLNQKIISGVGDQRFITHLLRWCLSFLPLSYVPSMLSFAERN